jgi:hypothetical protein
MEKYVRRENSSLEKGIAAMFTTITTMKGTAKRYMLFWRGGTFALLVLALLTSGFVGGGTEVAHASAVLLPPVVSSQQSDAAPALDIGNATTAFIGWAGINIAHNLNLMTYDSATRVFGPVHVFTETTPAGMGPRLSAWQNNLAIAWLGTDHRLNVGQYNLANSPQLTNKVTLNEYSSNAPALFELNGVLYLSWRGTDGHLNIITSIDGSHFGPKVTYPFVIRTSPSLMASDNSFFVAWEDMSISSHIVMASSNDPLHLTNLTNVVTTTSISQLPVGLESAGAPAPFVMVAWQNASDARIHLGLFEGDSVFHNAVTTTQTTAYGPAFYPNSSLPLVNWTGTDAAHHINVALFPY